MALSPIFTFEQTQLVPARAPQLARQRNVNLATGTYLRGTCLGEVTDTEAAAVQTLTVTGVPTGGTVVLTGQPFTSGAPSTITIPYNATAAVAQPLFDAVYGAGNTVVSGGALPGTALVITFIGALAAQPVAAIVVTTNNLTGGTTPAASIAQTTTGVVNAGTFKAYAHGNGDGSQFVKGILQYACTVDANGNITVSAEIPGFSEKTAPIYYAGIFRVEELVGLPSSGNFAVDFPGARISIGDFNSGELVF